MKKGRLEAFSDGVFAIIITIMVLELHIPHGDHISELVPLLPAFLSYVISFAYVGIYWNNHHHMIYVARTVNGAIGGGTELGTGGGIRKGLEGKGFGAHVRGGRWAGLPGFPYLPGDLYPGGRHVVDP